MYESVNWPGFKLSPFIFARVDVRACCEREREKERFLLARQIINNQAGVCAVLARFANEPAFSRCRLEAYNYMLASILVCAPSDIYIYMCVYVRRIIYRVFQLIVNRSKGKKVKGVAVDFVDGR